MVLKINLKTGFINCGFKVNLKSHLLIIVLRLIFKTVVDEYNFNVNFQKRNCECGFKKKKTSMTNILKRGLYVSFKKKRITLISNSKSQIC